MRSVLAATGHWQDVAIDFLCSTQHCGRRSGLQQWCTMAPLRLLYVAHMERISIFSRDPTSGALSHLQDVAIPPPSPDTPLLPFASPTPTPPSRDS